MTPSGAACSQVNDDAAAPVLEQERDLVLYGDVERFDLDRAAPLAATRPVQRSQLDRPQLSSTVGRCFQCLAVCSLGLECHDFDIRIKLRTPTQYS